MSRHKQGLESHSSTMTKSFLKQFARSESYDAGCLSGFMSFLDFHVGQYSQKFLSDNKRGSSRGLAGCSRKKLDFPSTSEIKREDVDDGDENKAKRVKSGMASVKGLMDEEICKTYDKKIQNVGLERSQFISGLEIHPKEKNKKKSKNDHVNDLCSSNLEVGQYNFSSPTEISSLAYDLASFMVQLYIAKQQYRVQDDSDIDSYTLSTSSAHRNKFHLGKTDSQLSEKHFTLYKAMADVTKVFLSQKPVDSNVLVNNAEFQTREFIDALEILSSNKELLVKLIQDQSLPPLKHIQEIQNALLRTEKLEEPSTSEQFEDSRSNEIFQKKSHSKFFRKKDKPKEQYSFHDISKIVVLKPTAVRNQNDAVEHTLSSSPHSHHSLKHQESYFSLKGIKRRLRHVIGKNRKEKHHISMDCILDKIPYGFKDSDDARKNAALACKTFCNSQQISQPSKTDKKSDKSKLKTAHPSYRESLFYEEALKHLAEILAAHNENDCSSTVSMSPRTGVSLPECNSLSPRFSPRSDNDIIYAPRKILLSPSRHQECNTEHLMEGVICEGCEEERSSALLDLEIPGVRMQLVIPSICSSPNFLHIDKLENPDEPLEKPERPSPVSVLEPFFVEDSTSPGSLTADHVDLPLQPQQIDFEDHDGSAVALTSSDFDEKEEICGFVTTLLQASGMSCYGALEGWNSSDRFLEPSVFEEEEFFNSRLRDESKLLYDCTIEVLVDTQKRLFNCTPWASLIKPSRQVILREVNFIEDICKAIDRNLHLSQFSSKDFEGRSWMDLRFEIEAIVNEIADDILEGIM